ncbi:hypothetical protein ACFL26_02565 [Patescibacteria group bacterium]
MGVAFFVAGVAFAAIGLAARTAVATYVGPMEGPPYGNLPITIWNRHPTIMAGNPALPEKQDDAIINIDGTASLGDLDLSLGGDASDSNNLLLGQALFYDGTATGADDVVHMDVDDYWVRLQGYYQNHETNPDQYFDMFSVSRGGGVFARGDFLSYGDVNADGCFGAVFVGLTSSTFRPTSISGYYGANTKCDIDHPGSHVCTTQEMLESLQCSEPGDPFRSVADGSEAWINAGPPGYTADANDCRGWTVTPADSNTAYVRFWIFNLASGGKGTSASCNAMDKRFACCK